MKKILLAAAVFAIAASGASAQYTVVISATGQLTNCIAGASSPSNSGLPANSWNIGGSDPFIYSATGQGSSKISLAKLTVNRNLDGCGSSQLQKFFLSTKPFGTFTLTEFKSVLGKLEPMMILTLSDVYLDSYQIGGTNSSVAQESLGFDYAKLCVTNYSYSPGGQASTTEACFDQQKQLASPQYLVKGSAAFTQQ